MRRDHEIKAVFDQDERDMGIPNIVGLIFGAGWDHDVIFRRSQR